MTITKKQYDTAKKELQKTDANGFTAKQKQKLDSRRMWKNAHGGSGSW